MKWICCLGGYVVFALAVEFVCFVGDLFVMS